MAWRHALASAEGPPQAVDRHVALTLALYFGSEGLAAWPSGATLAVRSGLALRTVRPALKRLCVQGWLSRQARKGPNGGRHKRWGFEYRARLPRRLSDALANGAAVALFTGKHPGPLHLQGNGAINGRRMEQPLPTNTASECPKDSAIRKEGIKHDIESAPTLAAQQIRKQRAVRDEWIADYERVDG